MRTSSVRTMQHVQAHTSAQPREDALIVLGVCAIREFNRSVELAAVFLIRRLPKEGAGERLGWPRYLGDWDCCRPSHPGLHGSRLSPKGASAWAFAPQSWRWRARLTSRHQGGRESPRPGPAPASAQPRRGVVPRRLRRERPPSAPGPGLPSFSRACLPCHPFCLAYPCPRPRGLPTAADSNLIRANRMPFTKHGSLALEPRNSPAWTFIGGKVCAR